MIDIKFKRGLSDNLPSGINIEDGTFYVAEDTNRLYLGTNGGLMNITDILNVNNLPITPIQGKLYLYNDKIWNYTNKWNMISGGPSEGSNSDIKVWSPLTYYVKDTLLVDTINQRSYYVKNDYTSNNTIEEDVIDNNLKPLTIMNAVEIPLEDVNGHFVSDNVEGALQELFQYADNGKQGWVNVVGVPLSINDTFTQLTDKTQLIKDKMITNLNEKGVDAFGNDTLDVLADKILETADEGGESTFVKLNVTVPYTKEFHLPGASVEKLAATVIYYRPQPTITPLEVPFDNTNANDFLPNEKLVFDGKMKLAFGSSSTIRNITQDSNIGIYESFSSEWINGNDIISVSNVVITPTQISYMPFNGNVDFIYGIRYDRDEEIEDDVFAISESTIIDLSLINIDVATINLETFPLINIGFLTAIHASGAIAIPTNFVDLTNIASLQQITLVAGNSVLRYAIDFGDGAEVWNNGSPKTILLNTENMYSQGMTYQEINALTSSQLETWRNNRFQFKMYYYLLIPSPEDVANAPFNDNMKLTANVEAVPELHNKAQWNLTWDDLNKLMKIQFLTTSGTFRINYFGVKEMI